MNFYRHYKNKPYQYIGVAKHSETLEDLVVYETRYENKLGKLWVRPRKMFEENIEIDGQSVARFEKVELAIEQSTEVSTSEFMQIQDLWIQISGDVQTSWIAQRLQNQSGLHLALAKIEGRVVGFKLGFTISDKVFYRWIGGVLLEFRKLGIAGDLMCAQHNWCHTKGYKMIQTKSHNKYPEMIRLNVRHGFHIVGTQTSNSEGLKIIFEKVLIDK